MIRFENINLKFDDKYLFKNFNLEIEDNKTTCIVGPSGAGKTTLLNMIANLVKYDGVITNIPDKLGYIFQESRLVGELSVIDNLLLVDNINKDLIDSMLKELDLFEKKNTKAKYLSGGEAKRVSFLRAFLIDSSLVLADEVTSSLDTGLKIKLNKYLKELTLKNKKTLIYVTHDINEAIFLADTIILLNNGEINSAYYDLKNSELTSIKEEITNTLFSLAK